MTADYIAFNNSQIFKTIYKKFEKITYKINFLLANMAAKVI